MKLTDDHKVQIFCSVLSAIIQEEAVTTAAVGSSTGSGIGAKSSVEKASPVAAEAIGKLLSKAWE